MIYEYADRAIKDMNRRNLRLFDKLKILKFDELNILRTVRGVYDDSARIAKKRYKSIYCEAYLYACRELGLKREEPDDDILNDWLLDMLEDYDALTHYRFGEETERKKARTAEALIATKVDAREVERALKLWTLQTAAYADRSVLDGRIKAFKDAGVKKVRWVTYGDDRVCQDCHDLEGKIFDIDDAPPRQHFRCRCYLVPA